MRILADVDTGIDDALALCWLAARPDVHLAAVTTSAGNTTAHQAAVNSAAVLAACGRPDGCAGRHIAAAVTVAALGFQLVSAR